MATLRSPNRTNSEGTDEVNDVDDVDVDVDVDVVVVVDDDDDDSSIGKLTSIIRTSLISVISINSCDMVDDIEEQVLIVEAVRWAEVEDCRIDAQSSAGSPIILKNIDIPRKSSN